MVLQCGKDIIDSLAEYYQRQQEEIRSKYIGIVTTKDKLHIHKLHILKMV